MPAMCTLPAELNQCKYYDQSTGTCRSEASGCGMRQDVPQKPAVAEKWFEPYLSGTRRKK